jgi:hypothetical protein
MLNIPRQKTVTQGDWCVSVETSSAYAGATLRVHKRDWFKGQPRRGEGYGRHFSSSEAAWAFALEHGYIEVWRKGWCHGCRTQHWFCGHRSGVCAQHGGYKYDGCIEAQIEFDKTRPLLQQKQSAEV